MSRPTLKCTGCGDDICIGQRFFTVGDDNDYYCEDCINSDILDESFFEYNFDYEN